MQTNAGLHLLNTAEAADYLRIKERKLYELVAEQAIPCTKVTGKWLFPRADLDRWLLAGMARPYGVTPAEPPPIVGGSHDPLLQWALVESRAGLAILPEGSESGYRRFLKGEVIAAAIHFQISTTSTRTPTSIWSQKSRPSTTPSSCISVLATKETGVVLNPGDVIHAHSGGGGGWGEPAKRAAEARAEDAALGFVTT